MWGKDELPVLLMKRNKVAHRNRLRSREFLPIVAQGCRGSEISSIEAREDSWPREIFVPHVQSLLQQTHSRTVPAQRLVRERGAREMDPASPHASVRNSFPLLEEAQKAECHFNPNWDKSQFPTPIEAL